MKHLYILFFLAYVVPATAQIVNIPDANFKNALLTTPCVTEYTDFMLPPGDADTNNDGEIQLSEAMDVIYLEVNNQGIASMEGIQAFQNMLRLDCSFNQLTGIDTGANVSLVSLDCSHNQITALDVDFNSTFADYERDLNCSYNLLTTLTLNAEFYLNVNCSNNLLTEISMVPGPPNAHLYSLNIGNNLFTQMPPLHAYYYSIYNCPIVTVNDTGGGIVSIYDCPLLTSATLSSGASYEVHDNPLLEWIDIKDGYSGILTGDMDDPHFDFRENPSLEFVCKDDVGNWYYEGEFFYQSEFVQVDPGVNVTYYCDFLPGGGYNTINGTLNYNCNGTTIIPGQVNIHLDSQANGNVNGITSPDSEGDFLFYATGNGTITPVFSNTYFSVSPANFAYSFPSTGQITDVEFCVTANGIYPDLEIVLIEISPARPGFDAEYKIVYSNQGTEVQSGSVTLAFEDSVLDLVSASLPPTQAENQLSWDFAGLQPFESREISFTLNVNSPVESPAVSIGDVLEFSAVVQSTVDQTPADNTYNLNQIVVGGYDPNDKAVSKQQVTITQIGEFLFYTIRFQNTGTYYAENVVIRDVLSNNLDFTTFEFVAASHPSRTQLTHISGPENINKVEFFFEGINLPAEIDNEPASHGFVTFKIRPKANLAIGNSIENEAEIYFDYNSAIVTNTVSTLVVPQLSVSEQKAVSAWLHPNPATSQFTVSLDGSQAPIGVSVYNSLGQLVNIFRAPQTNYDINGLAQGTYFVEIVTPQGKAVRKLIKI